jgi:DNA repair exonuclease SbcCD nuclease subunit
MSILFTADTHFTDNPRDEYRWGLLDWIQQQVIEKEISQVIIGGDLTDAKDRHSAALVNRLIAKFTELSKYCDILILCGNHDGTDLSNPFFAFLESFQSNITFIYKITNYWLSLPSKSKSINCLFLPCTKNYQDDWKDINFNDYDLIFTHATYNGAKSETGVQLEGIPSSIFKNYKGKVLSGDIHVPQHVSKVIEYVGSPYRIRFGDTFTPRVLFIDDSLHHHDLSYPCISKYTLICRYPDELDEQKHKYSVNRGDQVKVRVRIPRSEFPSWEQIKEQVRAKAADYGWELFGPELLCLEEKVVHKASAASYKSNEEILTDYIKARKLSKAYAEIGISFLQNS